MAAARSLWDDAAVEPRHGSVERSSRGVVSAPGHAPEDSSRADAVKAGAALPLLPMLQPVDEPRLEQRPYRFLAVNELDGPDYDDAIDDGDRAAGERDAVLYGTTENVRVGWTKEGTA